MTKPEQPEPDFGMPADSSPQNWVGRYAPARLRPYFLLARLDRPIGIWLLLWPCWWSIALAATATSTPMYQVIDLFVLFAIGAVVMRGAGCAFNDIIDRNLDAKVARTQNRPLPSGTLTLTGAVLFTALLCLTGLAILLTLNPFAVMLGAASLGPIAVYPFMKRITWWPQLFLGIAFNWGALLGWAAVTGSLGPAPIMLYVAGIAWTLGYDTIYAHQDKEDDALIGVRSTALRLGNKTRYWLAGFYTVTILCIAGSYLLAAGDGIAAPSPLFAVLMVAAAAHLVWQIVNIKIDDPAHCLKIFRSNHHFGALVFAAILIPLFWQHS